MEELTELGFEPVTVRLLNQRLYFTGYSVGAFIEIVSFFRNDITVFTVHQFISDRYWHVYMYQRQNFMRNKNHLYKTTLILIYRWSCCGIETFTMLKTDYHLQVAILNWYTFLSLAIQVFFQLLASQCFVGPVSWSFTSYSVGLCLSYDRSWPQIVYIVKEKTS